MGYGLIWSNIVEMLPELAATDANSPKKLVINDAIGSRKIPYNAPDLSTYPVGGSYELHVPTESQHVSLSVSWHLQPAQWMKSSFHFGMKPSGHMKV